MIKCEDVFCHIRRQVSGSRPEILKRSWMACDDETLPYLIIDFYV